jgi:hypothetical protein
MKKTLFTLSFILLAFGLFAQSFEGKVIYHNSYKSKSPNLTDAQLTSMLGDTQNWYIKNGAYKSDINGSYIQSQIYLNAENKLYSKISSSEALLLIDAALGEDEINDIQVNKGIVDILGYKCDELIWTTKAGVQKYYFSSKLPIDSQYFKNHKFANWYQYLEKAHAVPLKMSVQTPDLSIESIATEVTAMKLDDAMFKLPANTKPINPT